MTGGDREALPTDPETAKAAELRGHDLNLMVVFSALFAEGSVTRAAARLGMSQAAVSAALGRLRTLFDDPLFVRGQAGVAPTPKARRLEAPIRRGLAEFHLAIDGRAQFDPGRDATVFRLGMSDDLEAFLLPDLIETVSEINPESAVYCVQANRSTVGEMLRSGRASVAVSADSSWGPQVRSQALFSSGYAVLCAPGVVGDIDAGADRDEALRAYVEAPHVMVSADATRGIVDDVLEASGLSRRRIASTSHFAMAPLLVRSSRAVATMPRYAAEVLARQSDLVAVAPPIDMPTFQVSAVWHSSSADDPRIAWIVAALAQQARTSVGAQAPTRRTGE